MAYYDPYKGVKLWPDPILVNVFTGLANPVTLPANYQYLTGPPFLGSWLLSNVSVANSAYQTAYIAFYNTALPLSKTLAAIFTSTPPPVLPVISLLPNTSLIP